MSGTRSVTKAGEPEAGRGVPDTPRAAGRDAPVPGDGWTRRFVAAPPRLEEVRTLYERLGWEVRLEPPGPEDLPRECGGCPAAASLFQVIYTRNRDRAAPHPERL